MEAASSWRPSAAAEAAAAAAAAAAAVGAGKPSTRDAGAGKPSARDEGQPPEQARSLGALRIAASDEGVVPHLPGFTGPERRLDPPTDDQHRRDTSSRRLPPCREIARMDAIIKVHGLLMRPMATMHLHEGSEEHLANTCCCAFEREVTVRAGTTFGYK